MGSRCTHPRPSCGLRSTLQRGREGPRPVSSTVTQDLAKEHTSARGTRRRANGEVGRLKVAGWSAHNRRGSRGPEESVRVVWWFAIIPARHLPYSRPKPHNSQTHSTMSPGRFSAQAPPCLFFTRITQGQGWCFRTVLVQDRSYFEG